MTTVILAISITINIFQAILFWLVMLGYAYEIKNKRGQS